VSGTVHGASDAVTDFDFDADDWSDPLPDGIRHTMPGDDGRLACCGRDSDTIPRGDWMTAGADRVTCAGAEVPA
jgi:hypothetical protein